MNKVTDSNDGILFLINLNDKYVMQYDVMIAKIYQLLLPIDSQARKLNKTVFKLYLILKSKLISKNEMIAIKYFKYSFLILFGRDC